MGQQQLLLIILGVIIVGIAVAVGITMFQDNAESANRDAVRSDLLQLSAKAQQFYRKPVALGGGGNAWSGSTGAPTLTMALLASTSMSNNDNGTYTITVIAAQSLTMKGVGKSTLASGLHCSYTCVVTPSGTAITQNADE